MSNTISKYPQWFQEFLDAPTEDIDGYFGDWMDIGCKIEEGEDSITIYSQKEDFGPFNERPDVTFYGDQMTRRIRLVLWLYEAIMTGRLADAIKKYPDLRESVIFCEMPLRLTFRREYATEVLGSEWE